MHHQLCRQLQQEALDGKGISGSSTAPLESCLWSPFLNKGGRVRHEGTPAAPQVQTTMW